MSSSRSCRARDYLPRVSSNMFAIGSLSPCSFSKGLVRPCHFLSYTMLSVAISHIERGILAIAAELSSTVGTLLQPLFVGNLPTYGLRPGCQLLVSHARFDIFLSFPRLRPGISRSLAKVRSRLSPKDLNTAVLKTPLTCHARGRGSLFFQ